MRCGYISADGVYVIESGFTEAVKRFSGLVPAFLEPIGESLSLRCDENLHPLRGIIDTYEIVFETIGYYTLFVCDQTSTTLMDFLEGRP